MPRLVRAGTRALRAARSENRLYVTYAPSVASTAKTRSRARTSRSREPEFMLLAIAAYLAAHFAAYVVVLRHRAGLRSEKGIFLYHFASAVFAGLAGVAFAVLEPDRFGLSGLVLVLSLHGIYSLSFLELWSLAQGGYSLSIIASVAQAEARARSWISWHWRRSGEPSRTTALPRWRSWAWWQERTSASR